jgi:hypothetical protein
MVEPISAQAKKRRGQLDPAPVTLIDSRDDPSVIVADHKHAPRVPVTVVLRAIALNNKPH